MIIDMKKYLFIGLHEEIDRFFSRAQDLGIVEFISVTKKKSVEQSPEIQNLLAALKILRTLPVKKSYEGDLDRKAAFKVAEQIISLKVSIEKLLEEQRLLETEIARVAPFGDFSMDDLDYIEKEGNRKIQFFCMKTEKSRQAQHGPEVIYVATEYDLDYFITINREHRSYPELIEMRIDHSVGELKIQLSFVTESIHQLEAELKGYAGHMAHLQAILVEEMNDYHLQAAKKDLLFPLDYSLFAVEAWVPLTKVNQLLGLLDSMSIHSEQVLIEESDRVPTYMENKGTSRIGEDLVEIYDVPSHTDKDPSGWVFWSFIIFFAMIIADGGYGLLYLGLALYLKHKFKFAKGSVKRLLKLFTIISVACVVWGVCTASFFGLEKNPNSPLTRYSLVNYLVTKKADYHFAKKDGVYQEWVKEEPNLKSATSGSQMLTMAATVKGSTIKYRMMSVFADNIALEFALLAGMIHIGCSLLRYSWRNWPALGWVVCIVGGYLFFPSMLDATTIAHFMGFVDKTTGAEIGLQLIWAGIGWAVLFGIIQKRLGGLTEALNGLQVFADILSYLRLYALGLASAILAETFNDIGRSVGLVAGAIIILAGHAMNIPLSMQSGLIHGLRLNFLEWYHYSFEGGGKLFRPLKRLKNGLK